MVRDNKSDPTNLTTAQLTLAIKNVTEVFDTRLAAMDKAVLLLQNNADRRPTVGEVFIQFNEKLIGIDRRFVELEKYILTQIEAGKNRLAEVNGVHGTKIENLEKRLDHKYIETAADISHLKDLHDERISGVEVRMINQISERDKRVEQQFRDQTSATALALSAADKAIENAYRTAEKAVAKAELAAEKGYLEAQIHALREAFSSQIRVQKDAIEAALASSDKAVLKAEASNEKRFEAVNEFRATLADQQSQLATKSEVGLRFKALEDRINAAVEDLREAKGKGLGVVAATQDYRYERGVNRESAVDNRGMIFGVLAALVSVGALAVTIVSNLMRG